MDKNLLDLYSDYLLSSFGPTTATGLSALLEGQVSHDQVTRFLSGDAYTSKTLSNASTILPYSVGSPTGRRIWNVVPEPSSLLATSSPPCALIMPRHIGNPRPVPFSPFVV